MFETREQRLEGIRNYLQLSVAERKALEEATVRALAISFRKFGNTVECVRLQLKRP